VKTILNTMNHDLPGSSALLQASGKLVAEFRTRDVTLADLERLYLEHVEES